MRWPWRRSAAPSRVRLSARERDVLARRREMLEDMAPLASCCQPSTPEQWRPARFRHTRTGDCVLRPLRGEPGYVPADG